MDTKSRAIYMCPEETHFRPNRVKKQFESQTGSEGLKIGTPCKWKTKRKLELPILISKKKKRL